MPRIARAFCPGCGREIRPETAQSIADQTCREFAGKNVLITFWVSVPPKTEPRDFFDFIQQQGYLRVWIDDEIVRVDSEQKIKRLGARVQVIQDRIAIRKRTARDWSKRSKPRCVSEKTRSMSSRCGGTQVACEIQASAQPITQIPFSTGWHCAHCDLDIRPPTPGLFSFNNPLGACPECRGFGRTIAIDLNRAIPDRSLSIRQAWCALFEGRNLANRRRTCSGPAPAKRSISCAFRGIAEDRSGFRHQRREALGR